MKKLIFCLFLVSCDQCGDNILGPDAEPEMPHIDPTLIEEPIPEVYPDASPDTPFGCDGSFPQGDGTGHDKHPEHKHCHG